VDGKVSASRKLKHPCVLWLRLRPRSTYRCLRVGPASWNIPAGKVVKSLPAKILSAPTNNAMGYTSARIRFCRSSCVVSSKPWPRQKEHRWRSNTLEYLCRSSTAAQISVRLNGASRLLQEQEESKQDEPRPTCTRVRGARYTNGSRWRSDA